MITATLHGTSATAHALLVEPGPFAIVGPPEASRRETSVRVRSALSGVLSQFFTKRVTLPSDARASADLAVALAIAPELAHGFDAALGELSLAGEVRAVRGIIPLLEALRDSGVRRCLVPAHQREAWAVRGIEVVGRHRLGEALTHTSSWTWRTPEYPQLDEVQGLDEAKAQLRTALVAGRDVLLVGDPGSGRTMLARRVPGLLVPLTDDERFEIARITSASGLDVRENLGRPFRAPHHTVSAGGLVGGGSPLRPGEVSLAHGGVLYLDEIGEFSRAAIAALHSALDHFEVRGMPAHPSVVIAACTEKDLPRIESRFLARFVRIDLPKPGRS